MGRGGGGVAIALFVALQEAGERGLWETAIMVRTVICLHDEDGKKQGTGLNYVMQSPTVDPVPADPVWLLHARHQAAPVMPWWPLYLRTGGHNTVCACHNRVNNICVSLDCGGCPPGPIKVPCALCGCVVGMMCTGCGASGHVHGVCAALVGVSPIWICFPAWLGLLIVHPRWWSAWLVGD
jgi:hypothetical protein